MESEVGFALFEGGRLVPSLPTRNEWKGEQKQTPQHLSPRSQPTYKEWKEGKLVLARASQNEFPAYLQGMERRLSFWNWRAFCTFPAYLQGMERRSCSPSSLKDAMFPAYLQGMERIRFFPWTWAAL